MENLEIPLWTFLQSIIEVSEKGANVARVIRADHTLLSLLIQEKTAVIKNERFVDDFKTLTDVLIQEMVKHDLDKKFPQIYGNISGEENNKFTNVLNKTISVKVKESQEETCLLLQEILNDNQHAAKLLSMSIHEHLSIPVSEDLLKLTETIDVSKLAIWIDPIDCTEQYIKGNNGTEVRPGLVESGLQNVLVLIGVYDIATGQPIIGVINQPFAVLQNDKWIGFHAWGVCTNTIRYNSPLHPVDRMFPSVRHSAADNSTSQARSLMLISEVDSKLQTILAKDYDILRISGAGYKLMATAIGLSDCYIVTKPTTYKWDTCSPHAILLSKGGGIVDLRESLRVYRKYRSLDDDSNIQIAYNTNQSGATTTAANTGGIIAYNNIKVLKHVLDVLSQYDLIL